MDYFLTSDFRPRTSFHGRISFGNKSRVVVLLVNTPVLNGSLDLLLSGRRLCRVSR